MNGNETDRVEVCTRVGGQETMMVRRRDIRDNKQQHNMKNKNLTTTLRTSPTRSANGLRSLRVRSLTYMSSLSDTEVFIVLLHARPLERPVVTRICFRWTGLHQIITTIYAKLYQGGVRRSFCNRRESLHLHVYAICSLFIE